MKARNAVLSVLFAGLVGSTIASAQLRLEPPRSPRNANYRIEARLNPERHELYAQQVVSWTNLQERPTDKLWFHLYWNAWRNDRSTWMLEDRIRGRNSNKETRPEDWAWQVIDGARLLPGAFDNQAYPEFDLAGQMFWAAPDDGNQRDRTVMFVQLPRFVQPGETVQVEMAWRARVPRTFARTGRRGDFYFIAHWMPKLGVYEADGWNCHQFHSATEFYSDYGVYDVKLTLPEGWEVGASGRKMGTLEDRSEGTVEHHFVAEDVHGFAWTTSPDYRVREATFSEPNLPEVNMRFLYQPEHSHQVERHLDATRAALKYYGSWYGPYPYDHVTVVDPAWGSGAGGMEYPTLFTCGTRRANPFGGGSPEGVTVHEMGHQFWYGVVGNNEFEAAWLDEGLNTFSTARTMEAAYGQTFAVNRYLRPPGGGRGLLAVKFPELVQSQWSRRVSAVRRNPTDDVPATPTWRYYPSTAGTISYSHTALWLRTLENYLGWDVLKKILSTFYERYAFRHPTPDDFFATANEVSPQNLDWFFDQINRDAVEFDYAIRRVESIRAEAVGFREELGQLKLVTKKDLRRDDAADDDDPDDKDGASADAGDGRVWWTRVVAQRKGDGIFPVDVLMVFEDGHRVRRTWDGRDRWRMFEVEHTAKLEYAVVDPDRVLMLDTHPADNSRLRDPSPQLPSAKWSSKWMIWAQDFLTSFAFFL